MLLSKITSILFVTVLLLPIGKVFVEMITFKLPPVEENPLPPSELSKEPTDTNSLQIVVSKTEHLIPVFNGASPWLAYGPRKWVGMIGLSATLLIFFLLTFSALFLRHGDTTVWTNESEERAKPQDLRIEQTE